MTITVSGYASLDHAMLVDRLPTPDRTSTVQRRLGDTWPSPGGAAYVARAASRLGGDVALVSWLGQDPAGDNYIQRLRHENVATETVDRAGQRSPSSYLFYDDDGHAACCFDPGSVRRDLTAPQRRLLRTSDWWVLAVGPISVSRTVLAELPRDRHLAWVVKADPSAFPPALVNELLQRADVITLSHAERAFLAAQTRRADPFSLTRRDAVVIETAGAHGVSFRGPDGEGHVPATRLSSRDTTGAGDTLAGAAVAAVAASGDVHSAVQHGITAASDFLTARLEQESS